MDRYDSQCVEEFHQKFGLPIASGNFGLMERKVFGFRSQFLREELSELEDNGSNLVKVVDAMLDFVYVAHGTAWFMQADYHLWGPPSFFETESMAHRWKIAPHQTSVPQFPHIHWHRQVDIIRNCVGLFEDAHQLELPYEALHHLRQATTNMYLLAVIMGVPWRPCWNAVHTANMTKVRAMEDGSDSKRGSEFDVVKPEGFVPPDTKIKAILAAHGAQV